MNVRGPITTDGRAATTVQALAGILDVSRNRISKWRKVGAPAGLDLVDWLAWLKSSGRRRLAVQLERAIPVIDLQDDEDDEEPDSPAGDEQTDEASWKARRARALAQRAELDLQLAQREALKVSEAKRAIHGLAQLTLEVLAQGVWQQVVPALDGCSPEVRRAVRQAHDQAVVAQRAEIAARAREVLAGLVRRD